jgi:hypothetical protein
VLAGSARRDEVGLRARARIVNNFDARRQYAALADLIEGGKTTAAQGGQRHAG